jgi:hypothetical protein
MSFADSLSAALARRKELTPKDGWNLVDIDDYEEPPENLYLVAHFEDEKEARAALRKRGGSSMLYDSSGAIVGGPLGD